MPQESDELRAKFPGDDQEAFTVLEVNYSINRGGVIYPKREGYKPTEDEGNAIDYLCDEWDYGYMPQGVV